MLSVKDDIDWGPPLASCNIETLELAGGGIDAGEWLTIFRSLTNLKSFSYSPGNPKHVGFVEMNPSGLRMHLPLVKDTLASLELYGSYLESDKTDLLGSLHDFVKLKNISIQAALLIGGAHSKAEKDLWEYLLKALEGLTLWADGSYGVENREDILDQIAEVVLRKESHFRALEKLTIDQIEGQGVESFEGSLSG